MVLIIFIVLAEDICFRLLSGVAAFKAAQNFRKLFIKTTLFRDLLHAGANDGRHVVVNRRFRKHRGNPHFAVDAVFHVRDGRIAPCHFRRRFHIAGADIAEQIAPDLCADPLPVRVAVQRRFRRKNGLCEVDICHALRRAQV